MGSRHQGDHINLHSIGTTEWTYNDIGRLTSTDDPWDFTHSLTYNAEGMITALTCEGDSRSYSWNSYGQMTSATRDSLTTNFTYNANSWITDMTMPNDVDSDYTYNSRGWMTDIDAENDQSNMYHSLTAPLFEGGRKAKLSRGVAYYDPFAVTPADEETDYEYDQENRLTKATLPSYFLHPFVGIER